MNLRDRGEQLHIVPQNLIEFWNVYTRPTEGIALARNPPSFKENEAMRAIAYSMDLLLPGLYIWLLGFSIRIGGSIPDDIPYKYPGKIHSNTGIALVLPEYRIFTTYQGSYDRECVSLDVEAGK